MKTRRLMAIKSHEYGTRHLTAGDEYDASEMDAIKLVLKKKARFAPRVRSSPQPEAIVEENTAAVAETAAVPQAEPEAATTEAPIDRLRLQATQLGIDVDGRWGVARLQHEIAQARR